MSVDRRRVILGTILAVAAVLRILHFAEIASSPVVRHDRWDETDMHTYHRWASNIAAGDVWTDRAFHPLHQGHAGVARYLRGEDVSEAEVAELWAPWFGGKRFHAEPVYPYLIAATYALAGPDPRWVFVFQSLVGLGTIALIWSVTRRAFGDGAAVAAAALATLYGPLLFYEMVLLRTTLICAAGLALVWLLPRRRWMATGLAVGSAILLKSIFVAMFVGGLVLALTLYRNGRPARAVAALIAGTLIAVSPALVRNVVVGAPAFSLSSVNGWTFAMANSATYVPETNRVDSAAVAEILSATDGRFLPAAVATLGTHRSPVGPLSLALRKLAVVLHGHEMPNNANFYHHRLYSRTLRLLVTFVLLAPLSLVGLVLAFRRWRAALPLFLLVGTHMTVMLIALNSSRYRMPLVVALIPFAGYAVSTVVEWARRRRIAPLAAVAVALLALGLWVGRPPHPDVELVRDADAMALLDWHWREHGVDGTRAYLERVLDAAPDRVGTLLVLGDLERRSGRNARAEALYRRVLELDPGNRYARRGLDSLTRSP